MKQFNITLNETEQQILIDSMMFFLHSITMKQKVMTHQIPLICIEYGIKRTN
ncbi:MAG: hypothetical protein CM15mV15_2200 [uncultured marine virus]|nr:MAG: hypothetical protein CM15mV15_2200 [uncultured marine virus]